MSTEPQTTEQGEWVLVDQAGDLEIPAYVGDALLVFITPSKSRNPCDGELDTQISSAMCDASNVLNVSAYPGMVKALDGMLDWALANRGTEHEFVIGRSECPLDHPPLAAARTALSAVHPASEDKG